MDVLNVILEVLRRFELGVALLRIRQEVFVANRTAHAEAIAICLAEPFRFKIDIIFFIICRLLSILYSVIVLVAVRRDNERIQVFLQKSTANGKLTLQVGHLLSLYSSFQCKRHIEHMSLWLQGPKANSLISRSQTLQNIVLCPASLQVKKFLRIFPAKRFFLCLSIPEYLILVGVQWMDGRDGFVVFSYECDVALKRGLCGFNDCRNQVQ